MEPLQFFRKAFVTVSPHCIAIIKMWLNKAIINFNYNIKWSEMPNSFNCTKGTSYLRDVFNMTLPVYIENQNEVVFIALKLNQEVFYWGSTGTIRDCIKRMEVPFGNFEKNSEVPRSCFVSGG